MTFSSSSVRDLQTVENNPCPSSAQIELNKVYTILRDDLYPVCILHHNTCILNLNARHTSKLRSGCRVMLDRETGVIWLLRWWNVYFSCSILSFLLQEEGQTSLLEKSSELPVTKHVRGMLRNINFHETLSCQEYGHCLKCAALKLLSAAEYCGDHLQPLLQRQGGRHKLYCFQGAGIGREWGLVSEVH